MIRRGTLGSNAPHRRLEQLREPAGSRRGVMEHVGEQAGILAKGALHIEVPEPFPPRELLRQRTVLADYAEPDVRVLLVLVRLGEKEQVGPVRPADGGDAAEIPLEVPAPVRDRIVRAQDPPARGQTLRDAGPAEQSLLEEQPQNRRGRLQRRVQVEREEV
ncbi:MAG: hypothetical protein QUU85_01530, partial [Candidatus Eisenbacteria bacterium]|nr:hypothetical protein [Candidatus Eisenbacteria bacterium]